MPKQKISLFQPNFQQGPAEFNAYYLPYSVGCLWAYACEFDEIKHNFELHHLAFRRDDIETVAQKCKHDAVIGFSTYQWNRNYNHKLASRIKELNPECLIIFGGPEFPVSDPHAFEEFPYIDIVVKTEGEYVFKNILMAMIKQIPTTTIGGCLVNDDGQAIDTGPAQRINDLENLPSPYLTGVFDAMVKNHPDITWNATLETNRGCPYQCTFCDWGGLTYNKVKKFGLERVFAELEWIGTHASFVTFADANLGMFIERDRMIIDKFIEVTKKSKKLHGYNGNWAKNQKNDIIDLVKKLAIELPGQGQGLTVSVQSMDQEVLTNIKRKNLDEHRIKEIFKICEQQNVPLYTELILGLPGETLDSWKHGVYEVFRAGNHFGINFNHAHMLTNTEMNLLQKKLYKMQLAPIYDTWSKPDATPECLMMVTATSTMPYDAMLDAMTWNSFIYTFHVSGITSYLSRLLTKLDIIDYADFYDGLHQHVLADSWIKQQFDFIRETYHQWFVQGHIDVPQIADVYMHGYFFVMWLQLRIHQENKMHLIFDLVHSYMDTLNLKDKRLIDQLIEFNKCYTMTIDHMPAMPFERQFDFDFLGYLMHDTELYQHTRLQFDTREDKTVTKDKFIQMLVGARKRNFGKAIIKKIIC